MINFRPAQGNVANSSGGAIEAGQFGLPADKGLKPGKYRVSVRAFKESGKIIEGPELGRVAERIPVRFNEAGSLEATIVAGEKNHLDFELTSEP